MLIHAFADALASGSVIEDNIQIASVILAGKLDGERALKCVSTSLSCDFLMQSGKGEQAEAE